jgi:hypothetical protein
VPNEDYNPLYKEKGFGYIKVCSMVYEYLIVQPVWHALGINPKDTATYTDYQIARIKGRKEFRTAIAQAVGHYTRPQFMPDAWEEIAHVIADLGAQAGYGDLINDYQETIARFYLEQTIEGKQRGRGGQLAGNFHEQRLWNAEEGKPYSPFDGMKEMYAQHPEWAKPRKTRDPRGRDVYYRSYNDNYYDVNGVPVNGAQVEAAAAAGEVEVQEVPPGSEPSSAAPSSPDVQAQQPRPPHVGWEAVIPQQGPAPAKRTTTKKTTTQSAYPPRRQNPKRGGHNTQARIEELLGE